jgi:hypothetical protein
MSRKFDLGLFKMYFPRIFYQNRLFFQETQKYLKWPIHLKLLNKTMAVLFKTGNN